METEEVEIDQKLAAVQQTILDYIDDLEDKELKLEGVEDLLHFLNFQKRFLSLSNEELAHCCKEGLSEAAKKRLDQAKDEAEYNELIDMFARARYFNQCAWVSYFNGETDEKPFTSPESVEKVVSE